MFISHGVRFGLRSERAGVLGPVEAVLPPHTSADCSARVRTIYSVVRSLNNPAVMELYRDDLLICSERERHVLRRRVAAQVRWHVAVNSPRRVFVHAGAVALADRGILIPGDSFQGKSTLVAALVRAGATYYSDDYAVLDGFGRLHPFAKAISLRPDGSTLGVDHPLSHFRGREGKHPVPVATILVTRHRPGATWRPARVTTGDGALALMQSAPGAHQRPRATLAAVSRAASGTQVLVGARGEASEVVSALLSSTY